MRLFVTGMVALLLVSGMVRGADVALSLARDLLDENQYDLAAVEFRRVARETTNRQSQASAYLAAGYAYLRSGDRTLTEKMVDRAETYNGFADERMFLNAEAARMVHDDDVALYYYELLAAEAQDVEFQTWAHRRSALIHAQAGNLDAARRELAADPNHTPGLLATVDAYETAPRKRPLIGGLLGLFPGAGYWYSGEVANGFRSLILNSLFLYGMVQTADADDWGAFTVISFFEITWYSGSIYGGIDAAHRYNRAQFEMLRREIEGDLSFAVDPSLIVPIFKLNVSF